MHRDYLRRFGRRSRNDSRDETVRESSLCQTRFWEARLNAIMPPSSLVDFKARMCLNSQSRV